MKTFTSNHLEVLADSLVESLHTEMQVRTVILADSEQRMQWLKLYLSERLGVLMGVQFDFIADYLWHLADVGEHSPLQHATLSVKIHGTLTTNRQLASKILHEADNELGRWFLAKRLAQLFAKYAVFRPEWLMAWSRGRSGERGSNGVPWDWQQQLWSAVFADHPLPEIHPLTALAQLAINNTRRLPQQLWVFAPMAMPPLYLETLRGLSENPGSRIDVRLLLLSPCREYWQNLIDMKKAARIDQPLYEVSNTLLAYQGAAARRFHDDLLSLDLEGHEDYRSASDATMLAALQNHWLTLEAVSPPAVDDTIALHLCHGPLREAEVVRDELAKLFSADPALRLSDVAVLTSDVDRYLPFLQATLGTWVAAPTPSPDGLLWRRIIHCAQGRLDIVEVWQLLENSQVCGLLSLDIANLQTLRRHLAAAAVHWGTDGPLRQRLGLPATSAFTWTAGLQRLYLASLLPDDCFNSLPPDQLQHLTEVHNLVDNLSALHALTTERSRTLGDWCLCMGEWLRCSVFHAAPWRETLHLALEQLSDVATRSAVSVTMSWPVFWNQLDEILGCATKSHSHFSGHLRVANLSFGVPCPCKVLVLMGMDDAQWPPAENHNALDWMRRRPQPQDPHLRDEALYALLEAVCATRQKLIITAPCLDPQNLTQPSPPIINLLQEVVADAKTLIREHPLHAYEVQQEPAQPWRFVTALPASAAGNSDKPDLNRLKRFFDNPVRFFLKDIARLPLPDYEDVLGNDEPFQPPLWHRDLRRLFYEAGPDSAAALEAAQQRGWLPEGDYGRATGLHLWHELQELAHSVRDACGSTLMQEIPIDGLAGLQDSTVLGHMDRDVFHQVNYLNIGHSARTHLRFWLDFVALCERHRNIQHAELHGPDKTLRFARPSSTTDVLRDLLQIHELGQQAPLPFGPQDSKELLDEADDVDMADWISKDPLRQIAFQGQWPSAEELLRIAQLVWEPCLAALGKRGN